MMYHQTLFFKGILNLKSEFKIFICVSHICVDMHHETLIQPLWMFPPFKLPLMLLSDSPTCKLHDSKEFTSSLHIFPLIETPWSQVQILT
jgi:hypothetical protein